MGEFYINPTPGGPIAGGRFIASVTLSFTDGVAAEQSLATAFPDISGSAVVLSIAAGTLPASMTLDPLGKTVAYDGTAGASSATVSILAKPNAPSLTFSNAAGMIPVMAGIVFPEGAVTGPFGASDAGLRVSVLRTWADGSAKHAVVCGRVDASARVTFNKKPISGSALTSASIQAAAPTAAVDLGALGSVALSSLLATPTKTWISTEKMVECHYRGRVGATDIYALFYVRLWDNGTMWIRAAVENSNRIYASGTIYSLTGSVTIDGTTVKTYAAESLYKNTQHIFERWVGATQYDVVVNHDVKQIGRTRLVPNYGMASSISDAALNALPTAYVVGDRLLYSLNMGAGGYQDGIGLLPRWDADYLVSGDARAWRSVQAHGKAAFNYPILWRENDRILCPTDHPTENYGGASHGGITSFTAGTLTWEIAHHPSMGYLAYMLTCDALYSDAMLGLCATMFQSLSTGAGNGTSRLENNDQTRSTAWFKRSVGQAAALARDSSVEMPTLAAWLSSNIDYYASISIEDSAAVNSEIGYPQTISTYNPAAPLTIAPWMHHFWIGTMGYVSEIGALSGAALTKFNNLRNWMYRGIVGLLGDGSGYCYTYASKYNLVLSSEVVPNYAVRTASQLYQTWAEVMAATNGAQSCGTTLLGSGAESPAEAYTAYWGNILPAISYAVDHGAPGAAAAWARLTGATNWSGVVGSNWSSVPIWGCKPRAAAASAQRSVSVTVTGSGFFSSAAVPGSYNAASKLWTPGRGGDGRITQDSWALVPTDGTWVEVAGTAFTTQVQPLLTAALPTYSDPGSSDLASVLNAYAGFAHDTVAGRIFAHGGGHQDGANNGVYRCDLAKLTWAIAKLPDMQTYWPSNYRTNPPRDNSYTQYTNATDAVAADPTTAAFWHDEFYDPIQPLASTRNPCARHTYQAMTFSGGKLRHGVRRYWEWDEASGNWLSKFPLGKNATTHLQAGSGYCGSAIKGTFDEVNGKYYCTPTSPYGVPTSAFSYNTLTDTWTFAPTGVIGGYEAYYAAFARRGRDWCSFTRPDTGGNFWPPKLKALNLDTMTVTATTLSGIVQANCVTGFDEATIMEYVPDVDKFLVLMAYDKDNVFAAGATLPLVPFWIDVAAGTMTYEAQAGVFPALTMNSMVKSKFFYSPQLHALVLVENATTNMKIRRFA